MPVFRSLRSRCHRPVSTRSGVRLLGWNVAVVAGALLATMSASAFGAGGGTLGITSAGASYRAPGSAVQVNVEVADLSAAAVGVQLFVEWDQSELTFVSASGSGAFALIREPLLLPVPGAPTRQRLALATGLVEGGTGITSGVLGRINFTVADGALLCAPESVLAFGPTGTVHSTMLSALGGNAIPFSPVASVVFGTDTVPPTLTGVPESVVLSPGTTTSSALEAFVEAVVTAPDACGAITPIRLVTLPDGGTSSSFPTVFPVGVTTVQWTATDGSSNTAVLSRTVTVEPCPGPFVTYYLDNDGDGYGQALSTTVTCVGVPAGYAVTGGDCNDGSSSANPGAIEACNGVDDNCVGGIDEGFVDTDSDGVADCVDGDDDGDGQADGADCAPLDRDIYTGAVESCDSVDSDCDGSLVDGFANADGDAYPDCIDTDRDGDGYDNAQDNCPDVPNPTQANLDSDSQGDACDTDRDGDGTANSDDLCPDAYGLQAPISWYRDADSDGAGDPDTYVIGCAAPASGWVAVAGDLCPGNGDLQAPIGYFLDGDGDQYGAGVPISFCATSAPKGHSQFGTDCNDANPAIHSEITYFADTDGDRYGDPSAPQEFCQTAPPTGFVANALDTCANDPLKTDPGTCGCGIPDTDDDGDGTIDCVDATPPMFLDAGTGLFVGADAQQIVIEVKVGRQPTAEPSTGAAVALTFDPSKLAFVSVAAGQAGVANGTFTEVVVGPVSSPGAVSFGIGNPGGRSSSEPATVARLTFRAASDLVEICGDSGVIGFNAALTRLVSSAGTPTIVPTLADLGPITVYAGDALVGVPDGDSYGSASGWPRAADANRQGALFTQPTVTAFSPCGTDPAVALLITYPAGHTPATSTTWPADSVFPVGTTTVTWSAQFGTGPATVETRAFTVRNHALMEIGIELDGYSIEAHARGIEFSLDGGVQWQPATVQMSASTGATQSVGTGSSSTGLVTVQVPVTTAPGACVLVRDPIRSLVSAATPTASGSATAWSLAVDLVQGESNQDGVVDILDYVLWALDFGLVDGSARSDFNADTFVDSLDFTFISANFFKSGADSCSGGGVASSSARERISVRELRRMGQGEMAVVDLNGDGWVDLDDITQWSQGVRPKGY